MDIKINELRDFLIEQVEMWVITKERALEELQYLVDNFMENTYMDNEDDKQESLDQMNFNN